MHSRQRTTGNCAKPFLPSCVPDLQLDPFVVEEDLLDLEVDTASGDGSLAAVGSKANVHPPAIHLPDGCDKAGSERVLGKPQQETTFADACGYRAA